jgi:hypothetical protein
VKNKAFYLTLGVAMVAVLGFLYLAESESAPPTQQWGNLPPAQQSAAPAPSKDEAALSSLKF